MILPPILSLILFGFACLIAGLALVPRGAASRLSERVLSLIAARFGEPVSNPPAEVLRAFHRGKRFVVLTAQDRAHVHAATNKEIASC